MPIWRCVSHRFRTMSKAFVLRYSKIWGAMIALSLTLDVGLEVY